MVVVRGTGNKETGEQHRPQVERRSVVVVGCSCRAWQILMSWVQKLVPPGQRRAHLASSASRAYNRLSFILHLWKDLKDFKYFKQVDVCISN